MAYHINAIEKGEIGEFSKITEEYEEACDAIQQNNPVMLLLELSDLIGAIGLYSKKHHNISLDDLLKMNDTTQSAFLDGTRK